MRKLLSRIDFELFAALAVAALALVCMVGCSAPAKCTYKCCEGVDTGECLCHLTGVCICDGHRSCPACKHRQTPEVEAALKQERLREQARKSHSGMDKR